MTRIHTLGLISICMALGACSSTTTEPRHVAVSSRCEQLEDSQAVLDRFYAPGNVYSAHKIEKTEFLARALQPKRTMGADLYLHAPRDVSQGYFERVLKCHAATGRSVHSNDPLHPSQGAIAQLSVRTVGDSLAVRVMGDDSRTGREIFQRAKALASPSSSVTVEQVASTAGAKSNL